MTSLQIFNEDFKLLHNLSEKQVAKETSTSQKFSKNPKAPSGLRVSSPTADKAWMKTEYYRAHIHQQNQMETEPHE